MGSFYSDPRYGVTQQSNMSLAADTNQTSAQGSTTTEVAGTRIRVEGNITVTDFTVRIGATGDTGTSGTYLFKLLYSLAGTGALTAIGTASVVATTGVANYGLVAGSVTETNLVAGDLLTFGAGPGTVLPAGKVTLLGYQINYKEHFVA